ncbi:hypothetical protein DAI22_08g129500 [Oryza sativa Japonica Group]|nr:hypothetical protein DAI22_08g129500 [Oryza sativa Japonica Group]
MAGRSEEYTGFHTTRKLQCSSCRARLGIFDSLIYIGFGSVHSALRT